MSASIIPTKSVSSTIPSPTAVPPSVEASQIVDPTVISLENPLVIVGIVGAVVLFILFVTVLYYMKRRKRRKTNVLEYMESSPHTRAGESSENPMKTVKPYIFERKSSLRKKRPPSSSNTRSSVVGAKSYIPQKRQESKMEALPPRRQIDPLIAAEYEQHFNIHSAASSNRDSFSTVSTPESLTLESNGEDTIIATRNSFVANIESSFNRRQNLIVEKEKETAKEDEPVADGDDDIVSDVFDQYALPTNTYNEGTVNNFVQFNETAAIPGLPEINIIASTPSPAHSYLSSVEQSSWYNYQSVENPYDGEFDDMEPNNDMVDDDFEYVHDTDSMSDSDSEGSSMKSNEEIEEVEETEIAPTVERPIPELISESLASNAPEYIVIKNYEPLLAKELHLQKGDKIAVIEVYENNGMAYGVNRDTKEVGFFPVSCLELDIEGSDKWSNWAGTYTCTPSHFVKVHSELEILQIIKQASLLKKKIRVVGSGHSPSDIVCTADIMLDISAFNKIVNVDSKSNLVTVQAGIVLHELNQKLDELGLALDILGSISDQTLAGSISTCTHGTGAGFSLMADMIHTFKFITSDGGIHQVTRENPPLFKALQCSLGCLGIITEITIKAVPKFNLSVQQNPLKFTDMLNNFTTLSRSSDHVRFFWFPHTSRKENNDDDCIIWSAERIITKSNTQQPEQTLTQKMRTWVDDRLIGHHIYELSLYAASFSPSLLPYINRKYFGKYFADPVNITDKSFSLFNFDCLFKQYTTEWAVNIEQATSALNELNAYLHESQIKVHGPIEIRFAKEDDIWLSPAYEQNVCFIGIIMFRPFKTDVPYIKSYWQGYENIMMRHGGRPHWGKAFDLTPRELSVLFPRFNAFRDLRTKLDPEGMFTNEYIDRHILGVTKSRL